MRLNAKRRQRFKRKMKIRVDEYKKGLIDFSSLKQTIKSYYGHIKKGSNSYVVEFFRCLNKKMNKR